MMFSVEDIARATEVLEKANSPPIECVVCDGRFYVLASTTIDPFFCEDCEDFTIDAIIRRFIP
jgi:hypothetical protein